MQVYDQTAVQLLRGQKAISTQGLLNGLRHLKTVGAMLSGKLLTSPLAEKESDFISDICTLDCDVGTLIE